MRRVQRIPVCGRTPADEISGIAMLGRYEAWREQPAPDGTAQPRATDFSGQGNHLLQATIAAQPLIKLAILNGRAVWRFDGTDDVLVSASIPRMNNIATRWYFIVSAMRSYPATSTVVFSGSSTAAVANGQGDALYNDGPGGAQDDVLRYIYTVSSGTTADVGFAKAGANVFRLAQLRLDGANAARKVGPGLLNASVAQSTPSPDGTFQAMMGAFRQSSPVYFSPSDVAAVFMGNTVLGATDIARIEAYVLRVFGLAA